MKSDLMPGQRLVRSSTIEGECTSPTIRGRPLAPGWGGVARPLLICSSAACRQG